MLLPPAQQTTRLKDAGRQPFPLGQQIGHQLLQRLHLAALDAFEQREVGRGPQTDVVGVLAVDALEAAREPQSHAGQPCGGRDEPLP